MVFNGFYCDYKWWSGAATLTREFNFSSPVNVLAFGALSAVVISGGQGCAFVGIQEVTMIDPNTGHPINKAMDIPGQYFPSPSFEGQQVTSLTFAFGSKPNAGNPAYEIEYANANMNILLWS
jgi:hypothetical protein